ASGSRCESLRKLELRGQVHGLRHPCTGDHLLHDHRRICGELLVAIGHRGPPLLAKGVSNPKARSQSRCHVGEKPANAEIPSSAPVRLSSIGTATVTNAHNALGMGNYSLTQLG